MARDVHILTKLWGLCAWCVRSQLRNFEQFAATHFAHTIVHDHPRSPTTSATSRTISMRSLHVSNIFRSQLHVHVGRNMVVSPVWLGLNIVAKPVWMNFKTTIFGANPTCKICAIPEVESMVLKEENNVNTEYTIYFSYVHTCNALQ